jgi:hypothetical protein
MRLISVETVRPNGEGCVAEAKKQGTLAALTSIFSGKAPRDPVELARSNGYIGFRDNWPQRNARSCDGLTGP